MSTIKGLLGEERVAYQLIQLHRPDYRVGNNVLMLNAVNKSMQVDHIVVSIYGLFIIETKNCKGLITGNEYHNYWYQHTNGRTYPLYNPIMQSKGHIRHIESLLWRGIQLFPLVCFTERCDLDLNLPKTPVYRPLDLVTAIKKHQKVVLTLEQVDYIANKFNERVKLYRQSDKDHIGSVLRQKDEAKALEALKANKKLLLF